MSDETLLAPILFQYGKTYTTGSQALHSRKVSTSHMPSLNIPPPSPLSFYFFQQQGKRLYAQTFRSPHRLDAGEGRRGTKVGHMGVNEALQWKRNPTSRFLRANKQKYGLVWWPFLFMNHLYNSLYTTFVGQGTFLHFVQQDASHHHCRVGRGKEEGGCRL